MLLLWKIGGMFWLWSVLDSSEISLDCTMRTRWRTLITCSILMVVRNYTNMCDSSILSLRWTLLLWMTIYSNLKIFIISSGSINAISSHTVHIPPKVCSENKRKKWSSTFLSGLEESFKQKERSVMSLDRLNTQAIRTPLNHQLTKSCKIECSVAGRTLS